VAILLALALIILLLAVAVGFAVGIHQRLGRIKRQLRVRADRLQRDLIVTTLLAGPRYRDPRHLCHFEAQVYSQHGEDGIISEILGRIGATNRQFVEIGVGDGQENNTLYRLAHGWSGYWFEAEAANIERITRTFGAALADQRLQVVYAQMTAENAAGLMRQHGVPVAFDLLSLDIDQNTSHVWRALSSLAPRIVVVEYNASIPREDEWEVDYHPDAVWDGSLHFGASLSTLQALGESLGYVLVGCELSGSNAFFVRRELADDRFVGPFTARTMYEPPRYYLAGPPGHPNRVTFGHVPEHQSPLQFRPARHR
jgi:hypothetical protein